GDVPGRQRPEGDRRAGAAAAGRPPAAGAVGVARRPGVRPAGGGGLRRLGTADRYDRRRGRRVAPVWRKDAVAGAFAQAVPLPDLPVLTLGRAPLWCMSVAAGM